MAEPQILPVDELSECFLYDPETGRFHWKKRPLRHFPSEQAWLDWNKQHAGRETLKTASGDGYLKGEARIQGVRYRLSAGRVAFAMTNGYWPETVDHIDGDPRNNRAANLREANNQQQQWNRHRVYRQTGLKGAYFQKGKWAADVSHRGKTQHLGRFDTEIEAHEAYCAFVREHRGEFANTGA